VTRAVESRRIYAKLSLFKVFQREKRAGTWWFRRVCFFGKESPAGAAKTPLNVKNRHRQGAGKVTTARSKEP